MVRVGEAFQAVVEGRRLRNGYTREKKMENFIFLLNFN